jgi:DNA-binding response OmpR family regulator
MLTENGKTNGNASLLSISEQTTDLAVSKPVLLIDADQNWQSLATSCLENAGYSVLGARDASEGLQKSGPNLGLIVLDLNLAGESGLILSTFLKRNYPEVPILLCTAMDHDEGTIRAMLDMGADQYHHKGTMDELLVAVGTFFKNLSHRSVLQ